MKKSIPIIFGLLMAVSSPAFSEGDIDCEFIKERATEGLFAVKSMTDMIEAPALEMTNKQWYAEMRSGWSSDISAMSNAYIAFCK